MRAEARGGGASAWEAILCPLTLVTRAQPISTSLRLSAVARH